MADEPTARQRENMSLAQRALQLYVGRDIEGLLALYHSDVVVTAPDFMNAGPFHGHEGYMEWISRWNEAWDDFDFDLRAIEPVGERHVVLSIPGQRAGRGQRGGGGADVVLGRGDPRQARHVPRGPTHGGAGVRAGAPPRGGLRETMSDARRETNLATLARDT